MNGINEVLAYLQAFPTMESIAEEAREYGVKGERFDPCNCVIARLIKRVLEVNCTINTEAGNPAGLRHDYHGCSLLSETSRRFAKAFDAGRYPELEE